MNGIPYLVARLFAKCGIYRKTKRLTDAADESHLLKQAEIILGVDLWSECESVEELSVEYWTLRKLEKEKDELQFRFDEANRELEHCSEQRNQVLNNANESYQSLECDLAALIRNRDDLSKERDSIIAKAHLERRKIESIRTKVEVLLSQPEQVDEVEHANNLIAQYLEDFDQLKVSRNLIAADISVVSVEIESLKKLISDERNNLKAEASVGFQSIGKANRESSQIAADIGLLDLTMQKSYIKIGHYLSRNSGIDPVCSKICAKHMGVINQMRSLRESILRNQKIASMAE